MDFTSIHMAMSPTDVPGVTLSSTRGEEVKDTICPDDRALVSVPSTCQQSEESGAHVYHALR